LIAIGGFAATSVGNLCRSGAIPSIGRSARPAHLVGINGPSVDSPVTGAFQASGAERHPKLLLNFICRRRNPGAKSTAGSAKDGGW
jgi:hypothetical protein